jgi:hypothetical protein
VVVGGVGAHALLPTLVEHHIRTTLADRGFPDASLHVSNVGIGRLALRDVHLADGLDLGRVELDRGLSLLWRDAHDVSIEGARATPAAIDRAARATKSAKRSSGGGQPFSRLRISDSVVRVRGKDAHVNGTVSATANAFDVRIDVRDPSPNGWSIEASGRVVVDTYVMLENGHVDAKLFDQSLGKASVRGARLTAEVAGNLSRRELVGSGELRSDTIEVGPLDLSRVYIPFAFGHDYLQLKSASAVVYDGELALDPVTVRAGATSLSVRARGLQLKSMLASTKRVAGSGLIDGSAKLHVGSGGVSVRMAELHARRGGTLRVADPALQRAVTKQDSPFSVQTAVANALTDFQFEALSAKLTSPQQRSELTVATRGRGRRNQQELDISIAVHGARDALARLLGGTP